jgi:glycosyltransferase involved in cell wall biosynthesis
MQLVPYNLRYIICIFHKPKMMLAKPDISLITSLYRSQKYLRDYILHVQKVAQELDLMLQIIIVANDMTEAESRLLDDFADTDRLSVKIQSVPRESLYASWNRGIVHADSEILGFWNVDDARRAEALQEGYRLLSQDAEIVDFAFQIQSGQGIEQQRPQYEPKKPAPKTGVSPFFMFRRSLYDKAGIFNENFRIVGDFEWSKREIVRQAKYYKSKMIAGKFFLHDDNLSGGNNTVEWVEFNTVLLWNQHYRLLRPVEPILMREAWETWGHLGGTMPDTVAEWLWGEYAQERYQQYQAEQSAYPFVRRIRLALARYNLIKSVEWDVHQKGNEF